jgi:hypothetical protein
LGVSAAAALSAGEQRHPGADAADAALDALRTIAVSRIYFDNFDYITAYWVGLGLKLAQVALSYGADDLHGTIIEEHIFHMAGATSPQLQTETEMVKAIRETRRTPVQRNTFYEPIQVLADAPTAIEAKPAAPWCNEILTANRQKFGITDDSNGRYETSTGFYFGYNYNGGNNGGKPIPTSAGWVSPQKLTEDSALVLFSAANTWNSERVIARDARKSFPCVCADVIRRNCAVA